MRGIRVLQIGAPVAAPVINARLDFPQGISGAVSSVLAIISMTVANANVGALTPAWAGVLQAIFGGLSYRNGQAQAAEPFCTQLTAADLFCNSYHKRGRLPGLSVPPAIPGGGAGTGNMTMFLPFDLMDGFGPSNDGAVDLRELFDCVVEIPAALNWGNVDLTTTAIQITFLCHMENGGVFAARPKLRATSDTTMTPRFSYGRDRIDALYGLFAAGDNAIMVTSLKADGKTVHERLTLGQHRTFAGRDLWGADQWAGALASPMALWTPLFSDTMGKVAVRDTARVVDVSFSAAPATVPRYLVILRESSELEGTGRATPAELQVANNNVITPGSKQSTVNPEVLRFSPRARMR